MGKIELLAPAGNFECLIAAVQSGADAVYLAGKSFGARSFADNFDEDELERAVDYCHLRNTKIYVTVNTLVEDNEFDTLKKYLLFLSDIGVDAIIVQDMGVVMLAKSIVPDLPVHASTQMTVHNEKGVNLLKKYGIKRAVLSRELSFDDIESISGNTDVELEVFGHGALCMCYSGQCLLSSIIGGRSGNRGKCAQPCRLPYSVNDNGEKAYYLSLKDLSGIKHLRRFSDIGIASLKIEGRMKGVAYVAAVVSTYRKYIDSPEKISNDDLELLDRIFNRGGLTDGYLTGKTGKDMFAVHKPDNPYLKGNAEVEKSLLASVNGENRKNQVRGKFTIKKDLFPELILECNGLTVVYKSDSIPQQAIKSAITPEYVRTQLSKTGGTVFGFSEIETVIDEGLFISAGGLNKMRRDAFEILENKIVSSFKRRISQPDVSEDYIENFEVSHVYFCEITSFEQFFAVKDLPFEKIFVPIGVIKKNYTDFQQYCEKIVIVLPAILRPNEFDKYVTETKELLKNGFHGVLLHNLSLVEEFEGYSIYGGFRLNIFNSRSLKEVGDYGFEFCEISPELTLKQIKKMRKSVPIQVMVYGRLPLTVSENCLIRNGAKCPCNNTNFLTDRMGMKFPVIKDGDLCRSVVLNCKKTFMGFDMDKIVKSGVSASRIYFTDESADECRRICDTFLFDGDYRPEDFTNGHFYKGVS